MAVCVPAPRAQRSEQPNPPHDALTPVSGGSQAPASGGAGHIGAGFGEVTQRAK